MTRRLPDPVPPLLPALLLAALLLTGCAPSGQGDGGPAAGTGPLASSVEVDTPALREARRAAGIPGCDELRTEKGPAPADGLPAVRLPCLGAPGSVDLSSLRGPMVVNLWASWCGPCREELPYYQQLHRRAGERVQVLGVDYEDTRPAAALELAAQAGVTYPSVADPGGELHEPLRVRGLPGLLLVDEDGRVVEQGFLVIESYEQLAGLVEEHLGVDVGAAG
jgi:thiol-disulfide isomerase/thioredoxin